MEPSAVHSPELRIGAITRPDGRGIISERGRKLIHLGTALVPVLVWFLPRSAALLLLALALAIALAVEGMRTHLRWVRYHFLRGTKRLLRVHERRGEWTGATYLAMAYFLALLLFPRPIAVLAMLYSGVGDAAAALVGTRWGAHRIASGKSWEGFAAALLANLALGLAIPGIRPTTALIGAGAAAILEFAPLPLDDNLRTTLGGAVALTLTASLIG